jgi:quercetin dioxygenase-like cupin family protein
MRKKKLAEMIGGWFVGDITPVALSTPACEVAVKKYEAGAFDTWHYHKVATEVTVVVEGEVEMNGVRHSAGDILVIAPGEGTDFRCLTAVTTVVVKVPGAKNDKYLKGQE